MTKKYLVTGLPDQPGSKAVRFLLAAGAEVRAYVHRQDERSDALRALGAELVTGDLLDFEAVRSALEGTAGAVLRLSDRAWDTSGHRLLCPGGEGCGSLRNREYVPDLRPPRCHEAMRLRITGLQSRFLIGLAFLPPTCGLLSSRSGRYIGPIRSRPGRCAFHSEPASMLPLLRKIRRASSPTFCLRPKSTRVRVYPLYGEKEYTFAEIAAEISKVTGKPLAYEQIDAWGLKKLAARGTPVPEEPGRSRQTDTIWQHFQEIAKDHQNGVFAGTNDLVEKLSGKRPISLPDFLQAHRGAFLA